MIEVHSAWLPTLQRENDAALMDVFEVMKPGNATMDHLNRVQLYLGTTTLADLCDNNGMYIQGEALTGK
eukprot:12894668-Ditylum_brightwellii.AAC.1